MTTPDRGSRRLVRLLAAALAALALGAGCRRADPGAGEPRRDVVVVLIDTLRPDHLELYGHPRATAPFLTRLAERSTVFRRAFSTSTWTAPATASFFTSTYPTQHGVTLGFFASRGNVRRVEEEGSARVPLNAIASSLATLPERFRAAGYRTFGLAANVNIGPEMGFSRGFDRFERLHELRSASGGASGREIEERLAAWEPEVRAAEPAFVYLHLNDVHSPYERHAPWYQAQEDELADAQAAYDSEIRFVDETLRRVFERFGWEDGPIVAVLSDHGEEFEEHGGRFHRFSLHRELLQVLMLVHAPGSPVQSVEETVSILDLAPTLLELAGLPPMDRAEGVSLAPLVTRDGRRAERLRERLPSRVLFAHRRQPRVELALRSALQGDVHLIVGPGGTKLYHHGADPFERRNLAPAGGAVLEQLLARVEAFDALPPAEGSRRDGVVLDRKDVERLEALGYVD